MNLFRALAILGALAAASCAVAGESRFVVSGDGHLELHHAHFGEQIALQYRDRAGRYDPVALQRIGHFLRSRHDGKVGEVSLRLLELIDFVEDRAKASRVELLSAYRSPEFNEALRSSGVQAARSSLHTEGMAVDLHLAGVDLRELWEDLRELQVGGVGLYEDKRFLHIDAGRPRFWEPATSGVEKNLSMGNARVFARTTFDRYESLQGAKISLHRVTALPLRVSRAARVGDVELTLEALTDGIREDDGCLVIEKPMESFRLRIVNATGVVPEERTEIRLRTCMPRVDATPEEILSNPIERPDGDE